MSTPASQVKVFTHNNGGSRISYHTELTHDEHQIPLQSTVSFALALFYAIVSRDVLRLYI
jgi:hypothetical protein